MICPTCNHDFDAEPFCDFALCPACGTEFMLEYEETTMQPTSYPPEFWDVSE